MCSYVDSDVHSLTGFLVANSVHVIIAISPEFSIGILSTAVDYESLYID